MTDTFDAGPPDRERDDNPIFGDDPASTQEWSAPSYEQPVSEQPVSEPPAAPPVFEQTLYLPPVYEQVTYESSTYESTTFEPPSFEPPSFEPPADQPPAYERPPGVGRHGAYDPDDVYDHAADRTFADRNPADRPVVDRPVAESVPEVLRQPRPEDLLVSTTADLAAVPASWGWRGRLNRASGGRIKPRPRPDELAAREAIVRIQRSFSRPKTVVVVQPKGGAGKTPTTIGLAAAFGAHRGGYVVGWDDNETRGTLAVRVRNPDAQRATVWDLLSDLDDFERLDARVGDLGYYVRAQPDAHFDALVSDDNPANMAQIGDREFARLHQVLQRFYRMIVVDTGNNVRSANWQAAVNAADLVVVVSTYQRDVGFSASWVLDHLSQTGRDELARDAVTVLTAADPTTDQQVRGELLAHFSQRTRAVVEIPYDPELAHGGPISWLALQPETRTAWIEAGATVADALTEGEHRILQARRA